MHTETGRIYEPEQFEALRKAAGLPEDEEERAKLLADKIVDRCDVEAFKLGKVVPVSEEVVQKVRLGERELERRARRRKAAKQARRRNR